jgi:hypothetical protein
MKINGAMAPFFFAQHPIVEKLFSKIFAETKNACIFANTKQQQTFFLYDSGSRLFHIESCKIAIFRQFLDIGRRRRIRRVNQSRRVQICASLRLNNQGARPANAHSQQQQQSKSNHNVQNHNLPNAE